MSINLSLYLGYYDLIKQNRTISYYATSNIDPTRCGFTESVKVLIDENLNELFNITTKSEVVLEESFFLHVNSTCCSKPIKFSIYAKRSDESINPYKALFVFFLLILEIYVGFLYQFIFCRIPRENVYDELYGGDVKGYEFVVMTFDVIIQIANI